MNIERNKGMTVEQALAVVAWVAGEGYEFSDLPDHNLTNALATLRAEIADMREELDATIEQRDLLSQEVLRLEKDAGRLDWMEQWEGRFANIDRISSVNGLFNGLPSIRAAIDAAKGASHEP